jgi:WD40 repeat protein
VVSNLFDGLDWYKIPDRRFSRLVQIRIAKNLVVPVQFADGDSLLITGGTSGLAKVLDARTGETIQTLDHDCKSSPVPTLTSFLTGRTDAADDIIQATVCRPTSFVMHSQPFCRVFICLRSTTRDTSRLALRGENPSYTYGFPRPNQSQSPRLNQFLSPPPRR